MTPYDDFLAAFPDYATTLALDELRAAQYARLDRQDQVYLDYTGGGLHAASQVHAHAQMLGEEVLGNPHSVNPSSMRMTEKVEQARAAVLEYFNAGGAYTAIFTPNASGALKLVGESFPFAPGGRLLLTADNHNSVNGMREFARAKGAGIDYAPLTRPELRIDRGGAAMPARAGGPYPSQPVRVSRAVQLLRRQAPARARRRGARAGLEGSA
jgi:molybdenum cofactor sulfurtransferase